jgi:hypothetical protein
MNQQTSLAAYQEIQSEIGRKQTYVLIMLKNLEVANNTILAKKLGWSINTVTPRVLELREKGMITQDSIRDCPITHRKTIFWRIA